MNTPKTIATMIKLIRESRGWSQSDLARNSGFLPSAISHFETQHRTPSAINLIRLADCLGVSMDRICGRSDFNLPGAISEEQLITSFRKMGKSDQVVVIELAGMIARKPTGKSASGPVVEESAPRRTLADDVEQFRALRTGTIDFIPREIGGAP